MQVSLPRELDAYVRQQVEQGLFSTVEDAVAEAVRLMRQRHQQDESLLQDIRHQLATASEQLDAGQGRPFDDAMIAAIESRGNRRMENKLPSRRRQ